MKSCPTCNRTFEDTFTFCLADGSLLNAPFDPQATQKIPEPRQTEPPPTEIMSRAPNPNDLTRQPLNDPAPAPLPPTIASPIPHLNLQEAKSPMPSPVGVPTPRTKNFKLIYIAIPAALIVCGLIFFFLFRSSTKCPNINIRCYPNLDWAYCGVEVKETQSAAEPTLDFRQSTRQAQGLTSSIAFFQEAPLPVAVTDVRWTSSAGRIEQQGGSYAMIHTKGLSGQKITVTASVSGYGATCTASESFIAQSDVPKSP